jgi:hypothetical protein|tara:strand:+ start:219 stop:2237 length:2019 start_codon:yes stop_codon:yes gene_type:complete
MLSSFISGRLSVIVLVASMLLPLNANAQVTGISIDSRSDVLGSRSFGLAGPYEKVVGTVQFTLDPNDQRNKAVVDIDLAPRNSEGLVAYSADLYILKPKDPARGNGVVLFDVLNRGRKIALFGFNQAPFPRDNFLDNEDDFGDGFLMHQGFTIVWIGWQADLRKEEGAMKLEAPIATKGGTSIEGFVRYWFRPNSPTNVISLNDAARGSIPYSVVDHSSNVHRLTVREGILDERRVIPRDAWRFSRLENGNLIPDPHSIYYKEGFKAGSLYEIVYRARDPLVAGLGFTAVRDAISYLRFETDLVGKPTCTFAFGLSQSGRFLRGFLYQSFNTDLKGRRVFDGIISSIAGAVRSGFNRRFVQPSIVEPARFPFSDVVQTDPITGLTDGLLPNQDIGESLPRVFFINTSNEYWTEWKAAAMIHASLDGHKDLTLGENVRVYTIAGTQHVPGTFPPASGTGYARYDRNPNDYRWILRALLVAMDREQREGTPPPDSRYPKISDRTLVEFSELKFPDLPGVDLPSEVVGTYRFDDGPRFSEGIVDKLPPLLKAPFPVLLPQVDKDGNELGGVRLPEITVPLATYTGWNLRDPNLGAPNQPARLVGSYLPIQKTVKDRKAIDDPRPSIEERYSSRAEYLGLILNATLYLVDAGLLLKEDVPEIVIKAQEHWDYAMSN